MSFEVAIVGLGAVGSAAAWHLARRGVRVVGFDRFAPPHTHGSSHGESRITRKAIGEGDAYVPLVLRACELFRELERQTGESLLVETGGLWISSERRQATTHVANFFDNTLAAARRFGITHELLDAGAIRRRFPQFAVRDNESGYYEPEAGYLRPEACVRAHLGLAGEHGAELRYNERVLRVEEKHSGVAVTTERGTIEARQAIVSAGPWVRDFLSAALASRFAVTRQVQHWFEAPDVARYSAPAFPVFLWELQEKRHVIYGIPALEGGLVKVATEQFDVTVAPDRVDAQAAATEEERRWMQDELVAPYLPGLGPRSARAATCLYTATADFQFVVDRLPGSPRVIVASPCSGHGFKHSAAVGEVLADLATGVSPRVDISPFRFG